MMLQRKGLSLYEVNTELPSVTTGSFFQNSTSDLNKVRSGGGLSIECLIRFVVLRRRYMGEVFELPPVNSGTKDLLYTTCMLLTSYPKQSAKKAFKSGKINDLRILESHIS
ncbi:hypothetical protein YC2023_013138 [Brassica napus]